MTTKKKFVIALSAVGTLAVGAIVALVAVIAAFNATATSGVNISYTAQNVHAEVTAAYIISETEATPADVTNAIKAGEADSMVFNGNDSDESGEVTKAFNAVDETITKKEYFHIKYTIEHTGTEENSTEKIKVTLDNFDEVAAAAEENNLVIVTSLDGTTWDNSTSFEVSRGEAKDFYIRIAVDNKTQNAELNANFSFSIDIVE